MLLGFAGRFKGPFLLVYFTRGPLTTHFYFLPSGVFFSSFFTLFVLSIKFFFFFKVIFWLNSSVGSCLPFESTTHSQGILFAFCRRNWMHLYMFLFLCCCCLLYKPVCFLVYCFSFLGFHVRLFYLPINLCSHLIVIFVCSLPFVTRLIISIGI